MAARTPAPSGFPRGKAANIDCLQQVARVPPHPGPLPWGEGECSAGSQQDGDQSNRLIDSQSGRGLHALQDAIARSEDRQRREGGRIVNGCWLATAVT